MKEYFRQTGRTTRMIEAAIKYAENGGHPYIVFHNFSMLHRFKHLNEKGIRLITERDPGIDWVNFKVNYSEEKVFFDHFALECRFKSILDKVYEYNN